MSLLKNLQNARHFSSLLRETTPIGLPVRPDAITLRGCVFLGYHGDMTAFLPEAWSGIQVPMIRQKFIVDTALYCNLVTAGSTDRASDAPDSLAVYRYIKQMMEGPPYRQLELVAHDITVGVLARHLAVTGIKISIKRPYVPIAGAVHSQGVVLKRYRVDPEDV